jgi:hypothetical protein
MSTDNATNVRHQQRRAAIIFTASRTPSETARVLLADPRVNNPNDLHFLGSFIARNSRLPPDARERLIRVATPLMPMDHGA